MAGSYIPLYRKYRPQTFKDLVGQEAIVKTLTNAIELNKVAHAYLLTGPRGTGKTSTARIFAKALNCEKGPTAEPCGVCPSCLDIAKGNAIDVIEIDAASNRKVEDARNLLEKVQFVPVAGKYKVYIIDEVHMLTTEAFNTLLKTLEEPPENLVFILATTEAHKVLNTIISRCQRFDFRRISHDLMVKRLKEIAGLENLKISDQALSLIAKRSSGGMRDALGLLDQASVLANSDKEITESDVLNLLGSISEDFLFKLTECLADKDSENLIKLLNQVVEMGNEPVMVLRELMQYFRDIMLLKSSGNSNEVRPLINVSEKFFDEIKAQADKFEVIEIAQIIEKIANFEKTLKMTSQQYLWLEVALISICHRQDIQLICDLEERVKRLEEIVSGDGVPLKKPVAPAKIDIPKPVQPKAPIKPKGQESPVTVTVPVTDKIKEEQSPVSTPIENVNPVKPVMTSAVASVSVEQAWNALLERIESIPSRMFFSNLSKPVEIGSDRIVITFNIESFAKQAQEKTKLAPLEKAAEKLFGSVPRIITRLPMAEDDHLRNSSKVSITAVKKPQTKPEVREEKAEQITQDLEEAQTPIKLVAKPVEEDPSGEDNVPVIEASSESLMDQDISEQAKMIVDLFQGKIIE